MGRKIKYSKSMCEKARKLAAKGKVDTKISAILGIGVRTFYEYKEKYPQFSQALKDGKEVVDDEVENALLKRAKGFNYKEKKEKTDEEGKISYEVITKYVIPDVGAQSLWLHNRRPEKWSKNPSPITGDVKIEVEIKLFGGEDEN